MSNATMETGPGPEIVPHGPPMHIPDDWTPHYDLIVVQNSTPWTVDQALAQRLKDLGLTGKGMKYGNSDTGFRSHDLLPAPRAGRNFTSSNRDDALDRHGHGTHTIGSSVGRGGISYAPEAELWAVAKVLGDNGSGSNTNAGVRWLADQGCDVSSHSWGGGFSVGSDTNAAFSALEESGQDGCWIFAAAGNTTYRGSDNVIAPARGIHANAVSSHQQDWQPSSFTSGGPSVVVSAGGTYIISCGLRNNLVSMSGTSMATPTAASVFIILKQAMREMGMRIPRTSRDLEKWLGSEEFLRDAGPVGRDPVFGIGIITMKNLLTWIEAKMTHWV